MRRSNITVYFTLDPYPLPLTLDPYPLPVTLYPLPVTLYPLPFTLYPLPFTLTRYPLPLPLTLYPLPVTLYPYPYPLPLPFTLTLYPYPLPLTRVLETPFSREKGSRTKTYWNRAKSLQKPHRRKNNRQRTSGRVFFN